MVNEKSKEKKVLLVLIYEETEAFLMLDEMFSFGKSCYYFT